VEGVRAIVLSTTAHQKYHHLSASLARLGYLELPPDLASHIYPAPKAGLLASLERIKVAPHDPAIEVIYVQPETTPGDRCIDFARFAEHVRWHGDPFSIRFADHLLAWRSLAGARQPTEPSR
jgi:hypothetical protein